MMKKMFSFLTTLIGGSLSATICCSYGCWDSPISAERIAKGSSYIAEMQLSGSTLYWRELRPENQGRYTLVRLSASGAREDVTPPDFNVRTYVHEYGGGAFTVADGIIYASSGEDGAIYVIQPGSLPKQLTAKESEGGARFADMHLTRSGLVAVGEKHSQEGVENFLALIDTKSGAFKKIASGRDFYSSPAVDPSGNRIAWISWDLPHMPWTESELWVAEFEQDGTLKNGRRVAGGSEESIVQPQWSKEGVLYFISDRDSGWWNLYRECGGRVEALFPMKAELAEPMWVFGLSSYAFIRDKIAFTYNSEGVWRLALLDLQKKCIFPIDREGCFLHQLRSNGCSLWFLEEYSDRPEAVIRMDDLPDARFSILYKGPTLIPEGYISKPTHIAFKSGSRTAYGFFYPPQNKDYKAPCSELPPLIVTIHGGPTAQATASLSIEQQFWTSRGYALLDVNYGGSTGYGRAYRNLLNHEWGVVDVEDSVNGVRYLVERCLVDPKKLAIRGKSAGGYTTLAALAFQDVFSAGASYFGVSDITALRAETHKFESRYDEELIGKYPEEADLWRSRSPIYSVDRIKAPLILFQGDEDRIVPKDQSTLIYDALKARGIYTELYLYEGEGHGFRRAENIVDSLTKEADFYQRVFKCNDK